MFGSSHSGWVHANMLFASMCMQKTLLLCFEFTAMFYMCAALKKNQLTPSTPKKMATCDEGIFHSRPLLYNFLRLQTYFQDLSYLTGKNR